MSQFIVSIRKILMATLLASVTISCNKSNEDLPVIKVETGADAIPLASLPGTLPNWTLGIPYPTN